MAPSNALHHTRSLSLQSQSHPAISHFDDNLSRLRSSEASCSSLSSTNAGINGLRNLYESIDDMLLLPHSQQQMISEECVDDFISLLDACTSVKDGISLVTQDSRELLSAARRKDIGGVNGYLSSRRKTKKIIQKSLKNLRRGASSVSSEERSLVSMLKEAESAAFSVFQSLMSYTNGMKVQAKKSSWSLVSKLMHSNKASDEENEFNNVDSLLQQSREIELVNHLKRWTPAFKCLRKILNPYSDN